MKFKLILCCIFLLWSVQAEALNIVLNPGFEDAVNADWYRYGAGSEVPWYITSADAHTGANSATNVGCGEAAIQLFAPVLASTISEVSFWVKQPEKGAVFVAYLYYGNDYGWVDLSPSTREWEYFDVTNKLDLTRSLTGIGIAGYSGASKAEDRTYLDDVNIRIGESRANMGTDRPPASVPEPETALLLGVALLAFAIKVRSMER